ncbi:putative MFS family arabinose efflux permease [Paraburkholderia sp. GAS199]|uniref:MFS transporter n=1 Tax=Paraburkholderia sp. GAS199 TaxID=3035126 RepID=UPI003D2416AF
MSTPTTHNDAPVAIEPCWLGVAAIAFGAFALVVMEFLPIGLLPGVVKGFGISDGTAGLTVSATAALGFIAAPATALAAGVLDRRLVLLALSAIVVVSGMMSTVAPNFYVLLLARAILGIGVGGFWSISITAAARLVPQDKVARASSLVFAGISVASVVSVPLGTYIATHYAWRTGFAIASALAIIVFISQIFLLPRIEVKQRVILSDFIGLLKSSKVIAIYCTIIFVVSGHFCGYTFVTADLQKVARFDLDTIGILLLAYGVLTVVGTFVGGAMAGRDLHKTVYGNIALFCLSLVALSGLPGYRGIAIASLLLWALSWGMAPVGTQLWLYDSTRHAPEAAQSMNTSIFQLSITLGSLIGGLAVDHIDLHAAMWAGAVIFVLAIAAAVVAGRMDSLKTTGP